MTQQISTPRLILRRWREADLKPFAELNADVEVMRYFAEPLTLEQTNESFERIEASFEKNGFGFWAVEANKKFIGLIGIAIPRVQLPFSPCVEIGWRLAKHAWGQGYATEGAKAVLEDGFNRLGLSEIVSFTAEINLPSRRIMEKIGMIRSEQENFLHPYLPKEHELAPHVLYRMQKISKASK